MSKINVLVEGLDRTGKSTLVKRIEYDLALSVMHSDVPPTVGTFEFYANKLNEGIDSAQHGCVFDRLHHSNFAYAGVFGGGVLSNRGLSLLDDRLKERNVKLILMYDAPYLTHQRITGEAAGRCLNLEQVMLIQSRFWLQFCRCLLEDKLSFTFPQLFWPSGEPKPMYEKCVLPWLKGEL